MTKSGRWRDFPTKVTPSTPWGVRQTGFAGRQTASPYGSPGRPFHYACRLMLDRLLILATIVASAFALNGQKCIRLRSARFPVKNTTLCGWQVMSVSGVRGRSPCQGRCQPPAQSKTTPRQSAKSTGESCSAICFGVCGKVTFCAGGGEGVYCRTRPSQRQTRREIAHNTKQITTQRGMGRAICAYLRRRQRPVSVLHRVATGNFRFRNRRKRKRWHGIYNLCKLWSYRE